MKEFVDEFGKMNDIQYYYNHVKHVLYNMCIYYIDFRQYYLCATQFRNSGTGTETKIIFLKTS